MRMIDTLKVLAPTLIKASVPGIDDRVAGTGRSLYRDYIRAVEKEPARAESDLAVRTARQAILASDPQTQISFLFVGVSGLKGNGAWYVGFAVAPVMIEILKQNHPFQEETLCGLIARLRQLPVARVWDGRVLMTATHCIGRHVKHRGMTKGMLREINRWRHSLDPAEAQARSLAAALDKILSVPPMFLHQGEPWGDAVSADLSALADEQSKAWNALLRHCAASSASSPSQKWLQEAKVLLTAVGVPEFALRVSAWFRLFARTVPAHLADLQNKAQYGALRKASSLLRQNLAALKGLVWCSRLCDAAIIPEIGALATAAYKKIPSYGASAPKVGNACVSTLGSWDDPAAVAQLSRLRRTVPYQVAQSLIGKTLTDAAARLGITQDDLEEMALPTYGIDERGIVRQMLDGATAEIAVSGMQAALRWSDSSGNPLKSVPASVKREHAAEIKALQATRAEIEKTLLAQRERLEGFYLNARDWSLADWRARTIEHPLLGQIARRLIWQFQTQDGVGLGLWRDGRIEDASGALLTMMDPVTVSLWHPLESSPETVLAWRLRLEALTLVQPFKQAHREVYLLTDAERATGTYSNRFAAHIIKQHQFHALCRQRGWDYTYQGRWDSHNVPLRNLPRHGLTVEFLVEPVEEEQYSEAGVYLYLATDQVRFVRTDRSALPLSEIPPLLFSELMRDVDLFVGVASVGNDPAWRDGGEQAWGREYWQDFAFGNLGATAQTRRSVLERLLPRLKIAARCTLDGRFLIVRGDIRTYKIHLGSGNILMDPNDQYLCIVPGRSDGEAATETLFLPFEGDRTLSIILSKAFMLADDTSIKDPTIMHQIGR